MAKDNKQYKPMNSAALSLEIQMELDNLKSLLPLFLEKHSLNARILKSQFDSLLKEGFSEAQALEIISKRPLIE